MENKKTVQKNDKTKRRRAPVGWIVTCSILGGTVLGLGTLLYFSNQNANNHAMRLENMYQKSYYDFADNINNAEVKLSKALSTNDSNYVQKLLSEVSKNVSEAEDKLNNLPVSINGLEESLKFINQVGGYTNTLSKKLSRGETLSSSDKTTLRKLHSSIVEMKNSIGEMTNDMKDGYGILSNSLSLKGDYNDFTISLQTIKSNDVDYPTMIYDGPFADSQIEKDVKGLTGEMISMDESKQKLSQIVKVAPEEISFMNETKSSFETYDFMFEKNQANCYAQMTKKGGKLITMSSFADNKNISMSKEDAISIAKEFIAKTGVNDVECVWSDIIGGNAYLNFAPIENSVILYPDLIKIKVDLGGGAILGYEATSYYTNHTQRKLSEFKISSQQVQDKLQKEFTLISTKKALAPIEYSEILCYELTCYKNSDLYYFYFNSENGNLENVLRVIKTNDGNKLM